MCERVRFFLTSFNVVDSSEKCVYIETRDVRGVYEHETECGRGARRMMNQCVFFLSFAFSCLTKLFPQQVTGRRAADEREREKKLF